MTGVQTCALPIYQVTTMIDLPARCVGQNINPVGTYIIILEKFQPSYLPEIQIWLETGYFRLNMSKRRVATQIDEITLRDSRGMNYDSKLQNMSWFCYTRVNMLSQTNMITW